MIAGVALDCKQLPIICTDPSQNGVQSAVCLSKNEGIGGETDLNNCDGFYSTAVLGLPEADRHLFRVAQR
eukprot:scaffold556268_cov37-Prasinocladus_malaysianus.AAC.1